MFPTKIIKTKLTGNEFFNGGWWNDLIYNLWNLIMIFLNSFGESYIMKISSVWSGNIGEKSYELCSKEVWWF